MRGKVHRDANSQDFDKNFDGIHWDKVSKFREVPWKGNHQSAKHFVFDPDGQEGSVIRQ
jgi:hypothetical protein